MDDEIIFNHQIETPRSECTEFGSTVIPLGSATRDHTQKWTDTVSQSIGRSPVISGTEESPVRFPAFELPPVQSIGTSPPYYYQIPDRQLLLDQSIHYHFWSLPINSYHCPYHRFINFFQKKF